MYDSITNYSGVCIHVRRQIDNTILNVMEKGKAKCDRQRSRKRSKIFHPQAVGQVNFPVLCHRWPASIGVTFLATCCYLLYFCTIVFFTNKFELILNLDPVFCLEKLKTVFLCLGLDIGLKVVFLVLTPRLIEKIHCLKHLYNDNL